jgi:disulfide bond formation protein DsbB
METSVIIIIAAGMFLGLLVIIGKRLLRFAIRMALVVLVLIAMLGAVSFAWWNGWFQRQPTPKAPSRPAPTRRVSSP